MECTELSWSRFLEAWKGLRKELNSRGEEKVMKRVREVDKAILVMEAEANA
jgi:hypothetical protein